MAQRRTEGALIGRPVALAPELYRRILDLHVGGGSLSCIAAQLTAEGVPTARGGAK